MFKFILLSSALVLAASAFPQETTQTQTGSFFKNLYNGNLQASQKAADLIKNSVAKATGLGSDAVQLGAAMAKTGVKAGLTLGMKGVSEGVTIGSQLNELARDFTKNIPIVNKFVEAGTGLGDAALAAGLNGAAMAADTAHDLTNRGINVATGLAEGGLNVAEKSVATGTDMFKKGLGLFSWN